MATNPLAGQVVTLTPSETRRALIHCIKLGQPVFLAGDPAIGKSSVARQVAAHLYGNSTAEADAISSSPLDYYKDIRLIYWDPVDLRGMPEISNGLTRWASPATFPQPNDSAQEGLINWDEINRAPELTQNAALQFVLDRSLGEYRLPDGWQQIACGNTKDVGVKKMSSALKSRFLRINMVPHFPDWREWALSNSISPIVISYLSNHSDHLHMFDPQADAFPSPRTWSFVSRIHTEDAALGVLPPKIERAMIAGSIGDAIIVPYWSHVDMFRKLAGNFSIDELLQAPTSYKVPQDISMAYAVANGLSSRIDHSNIGAALTYLDRMPSEYNVFATTAAVRRDDTLTSTAAYTRWILSHKKAA